MYNEIDHLASMYTKKDSKHCSEFIDLKDEHLVIKKKIDAEQRFLPNTIIGDGVLGTAIVDRILFSLPISNVANRGFKVKESQFGRWAFNVAEVFEPLANLILEEILKSEAICLEERYAKAEDLDQLNCYYTALHWSIHGAKAENQAVYYYYAIPDDREELFQTILKDYHGAVQVDGLLLDFDEEIDFTPALFFHRLVYMMSATIDEGKINLKTLAGTTLNRIHRYIQALIQIDEEWQVRYKNNKVSEEEFLKGLNQ